jgi:NADPH-dependent curcumin reductase CurA
MRGRISGVRSYAQPVEIGAVIEGRVVGEVVRSRDPAFREGDYVLGGYGWQLYSAVPGQGLLKLDPAEAPLSTALGMRGLTAYVGLSEIGRSQRGETVVVSAASGAVGAVVGRLAWREGARVVGLAGGADKCRYVEAELDKGNCSLMVLYGAKRRSPSHAQAWMVPCRCRSRTGGWRYRRLPISCKSGELAGCAPSL